MTVFTPEEVAQKLRVHPNTIRDYLKDGILPGIKLGRIWRVEEKDLEEFIKERKRGVER